MYLDAALKLAPLVKEQTSKAIDAILREVYESGKFAKAYVAVRTSDTARAQFAQNISRYSLIRPIWGGRDLTVDIRAIYSPLRAKLDQRDKSVVVGDLADFETLRNVLVLGTVGQGKSTFIRHLCVKQIERLHEAKNQRIPILIELRNAREGRTVEVLLMQEFKRLGFGEVDKHHLSLYLRSKKFVLFLDGFDELPLAIASNVVTQIEVLTTRYHGLQAIIASRPGGKIQNSRHFRPLYLDYLSKSQFRPFFVRLCRHTDPDNYEAKAASLINYLEHSEFNISELLRTPLLLTLFWLSMRKGDPSPRNEAEFFSRLFDTLFFSHDSAKDMDDAIKFSRETRTGLDYADMLRMFQATSHRIAQSNHSESVSLPSFEYAAHVRKAEEFAKLPSKIDPDAYAEDIERTTNLLHMENREIHYVHKAVLDFHSAAFVKERDDNFLKAFYEKRLRQGTSKTFPEAKFLRLISPIAYNKYFFAPLADALARRIGVTPSKEKQFLSKFVHELENTWTFGVELHEIEETEKEAIAVIFRHPAITETTFFDRDLWQIIERDVWAHSETSILADEVDDGWVRRFVASPALRSRKKFFALLKAERALKETGRRETRRTSNAECQIRAMEFLRNNSGADEESRDIGTALRLALQEEVRRLSKEAIRLQELVEAETFATSWIEE